MDKITFITVTETGGIETEHAIIDRGNGEFTSMTKETYDVQQAQSTLPSNFADLVEKPAK